MKLFIIGSGNVANALGHALAKAGHEIAGVAGRNKKTTELLAKKLKCAAFHNYNSIPKNCEIYIIAIKDDAIKKVAAQLPVLKGILVHTSGSTPLNSLGKRNNTGVFYPVQTITASFKGDFSNVPVCLECNSEKTLVTLSTLALSITKELYVLNSEQRSVLHLAAVFTNNFTNHLLGVSSGLLKKNHLSVKLLEQLAFTTIQNAFKHGAFESQTGPAIRNDQKTIQKHLKLMKNNKSQKELYKLISEQILNVHNNQKKP